MLPKRVLQAGETTDKRLDLLAQKLIGFQPCCAFGRKWLVEKPPGAFYVMDRGYVDFSRLFDLHVAGAFFVTLAKSNTLYQRCYSHAVDKSAGLRCDQTIVLNGVSSAHGYPQPLRRIKYQDGQTGKTFNFLTNNFAIPAYTVAELYRYRWQMELFFKWVKQHLPIKPFFGTAENAVKSQIWITISVYVLVAIVRKRLDLKADL